MKVIYISGPYRAECNSKVFKNIMAARDAALQVWHWGGVALCPHLNTMFFGGAYDIPDQTWLDGDLELIKRVDALWAIEGWQDSVGSKLEVSEAIRNNIPVFFDYHEVINFLGFKAQEGE